MWLLLLVLAQEAPPPAEEPPPDIEITAKVTFRELRFEKVGDPKVEFTGSAGRETTVHLDRGNLPDPVQQGVTYRDGTIVLTITSRFAEALHRSVPEPERREETP